MKNEKLETRLNDFCDFIYWLLKQSLSIALCGVMALIYYQAGKASYFDYPENIAEACEQREIDLKQLNDGFVSDPSTEKEEFINEE